jgi:hypothetical protein
MNSASSTPLPPTLPAVLSAPAAAILWCVFAQSRHTPDSFETVRRCYRLFTLDELSTYLQAW